MISPCSTALSRLLFSVTLLSLPGVVSAQTYLGNGADRLDGISTASTFQTGTTVYLPSLGWTNLTGAPVQVFNISGPNGTMFEVANAYGPYSVQFITDTALVANSTYTLSFEMGYNGSSGLAGNANYSFSIGTLNGSTFSALNTASGGPVSNSGVFISGFAGEVQSVTFTTGASVGPDVVAVQWAQTNTPSSGATFLAIDNVKLSYVAVPEPSAYAAIFGGLALFGMMIVRRRRQLA